MLFEKATALVVRGSDWSETSRIATLFTREYGKIRALAKGGRRVKSSFDIAFDLLTVCNVVFLKSRSSGLDLLTEARMAERFPVLRHNLPALYVGYYVAELLADGTQDYDPHPPLFDAALATLRGLTELKTASQGLSPYWEAVTAFELVWLRELGYSPRLDECAGCGKGIVRNTDVAGVAFSPSAGGVLCPECSPTAWDGRALTWAGLGVLRGLAAGSIAGPAERPAEPATGRELRGVLGQVVSFVLGRQPRMLRFIDGS